MRPGTHPDEVLNDKVIVIVMQRYVVMARSIKVEGGAESRINK